MSIWGIYRLFNNIGQPIYDDETSDGQDMINNNNLNI